MQMDTCNKAAEASVEQTKSKPKLPEKAKMESSSGTSGFESDVQEPIPIPVPSSKTDKSKTESNQATSTGAKTNPKMSNCEGHRAGFDAFMTGFSFATFIVHNALINPNDVSKSEAISRLLSVPIRPEFSDLNIANRIYLVCKDIPFMVRKSAYSKNSLGHYEKYTKEYTRKWVDGSTF